MTPLQIKLDQLEACSEARTWVGRKGLKTAWETCPRGDWLLWLAPRLGVSHKQVVLAACACARTVLHLVSQGEARPGLAIAAAEGWCRGEEISIDEVQASADAAYSAAVAADAAAASAAVYAAAYAAYSSAAYAAASSSAASAAAYAASAAAYSSAAAAAAYAAAYAAYSSAAASAASSSAASAYAAASAASRTEHLANLAGIVRGIIPTPTL